MRRESKLVFKRLAFFTHFSVRQRRPLIRWQHSLVVAKADVKKDSSVEAEQHPHSDLWGPRPSSKIDTTQQVEMVRSEDEV
jgi:hypothetical protein